jgi:arsenate reductase
MDMFNYVMVLASIIIGLGMTHLLYGIAQFAQHPDREKPYWVHLVWVAGAFFQAIFWWWWEFRLSANTNWTFGLYLFVLLYAFIIYLRCALLFPPDLEGYEGYRGYFYSRRGWLFGTALAQVFVDLGDTLFKGWAHFASLGFGYPIASATMIVLFTDHPQRTLSRRAGRAHRHLPALYRAQLLRHDAISGRLDAPPPSGSLRGRKRAMILYGMRNCDTVKKARAWLDARGLAYDFHDYKVAGIDAARLRDWARELGWERLLNRSGTTFRKLPEDDQADLDEAKAIALMLAQPSMIKRPVLDLGDRRLVGFVEAAWAAALADRPA